MRATRPGMQERLFRILLRLYPADFRREHGEGMVELFRVRLERAQGLGGRLAFWRSVLADLIATLFALRRSRGGTAAVESTSLEHRGRGGMGALLQDVRYTIRRLRRAPLFAVSALALLAVGIGANTAVFSVVDSLLLRPPPFRHPESVVWVYQDSDDGDPTSDSYPAYLDMVRSAAFAGVAATSSSSATMETGQGHASVDIEYATSSYLGVLGLSPSRGRWFSAEEDVPGGPMVAVVSYPAWRTRFASDPGVVGRTVRLNGQPVTIVGVGPAKLNASIASVVTDFWLSVSSTPVGGDFRVSNLEDRGSHWYYVLARLKHGETVPQAQAAMDALAARQAEAYPRFDRGRNITVFPSMDVRMHPGSDGDLRRAGTLLMVIVGLVLVLACGNLGNLLLVRGLGRSGEVAVRQALGAAPRRVARLFLIESLLLSVAGGVGGVLLGRWALGFLPRAPLPYPLSATLDLAVDHRVILFSIALMLATGVLFGVAPALRAMRGDVAATLRDEARTSASGRGTARLSRALVGLQVAASLVLVLGAGLLGRSFAALEHMDTGVDADHVAYVRADLGQAGISGPEVEVTLEALEQRIQALPGVRYVGASTRLPAQRSGTTTTIIDGYQPSAGTDAVELPFAIVTPGYFPALGLSILEGRNFGPDDDAKSSTVVVVNEAAARRFWKGRSAVGGRMRSQGSPDSWRTVVGVVENSPVSSLGESPRPMFYFVTAQAPPPYAYLVARCEKNPAELVAPMRAQVSAVRRSLTVGEQGTLKEHFGAELAAPRFAAEAMGAFSLLAMLLASLGIYAVVASGVSRRSAELGIRMALGADRGGVVRMVVREVAWTVVVGLIAGVAIAIVAVQRLGNALVGVAPMDPVAFAGSVAILLGVSAVAAYIPARRAGGIDPVESLRT